MAWPKGKKRGTNGRPVDPDAVVTPVTKKGIAFFQEVVEDIEHKGRGLYIGRCPKCKEKELRVFDEDPIEARCANCRFWSMGVDQFAFFIKKPKPEVDNAGSQDQSEGRSGEVSPEAPQP